MARSSSIGLAQLICQPFAERIFCRHGHRFVIPVVTRTVAGLKPICRNFIFILIVGELHLFGALVEIILRTLVFASVGDFKSRIVVKFSPHFLLDLRTCHLKHPHKTHLQGREPLLQLL